MYDAAEVPPLELGVVPLRRTAVDCALDRVANRGLTPHRLPLGSPRRTIGQWHARARRLRSAW